ncbi:MAG: TonB-dependent receptor [Planctomycetaceae bacterium]
MRLVFCHFLCCIVASIIISIDQGEVFAQERDLVGEASLSDRSPGESTQPYRLVEVNRVISGNSNEIESVLFSRQPRPIRPRAVQPFESPLISQTGLFSRGRIKRSLLDRAISRRTQSRALSSRRTATDVVLGLESSSRSASDAGSLLGKSLSTLGVGIQKRSPIVTDTRIRGGRVGRLGATGSYWVPARIDLDTLLSKIDSRLIDNMLVIKGPYSAQHGPGFNAIDIQLLGSPRFDDGWETHAATGMDYKTNGQQWNGHQTLWGGDENWGFRIDYGHRAGNDYRSGDGQKIPSSYKSRVLDIALGVDLDENSVLEFHYLRMDQTDVEFPGQAFDIDFLVTDAYELQYVQVDQEEYDRLELDVWYNRTRFEGSAQRSGKRKTFPLFDFLNFTGFTDVNSTSTGFRTAATWGDEEDESKLVAGVDLRHLRQELNEISSGHFGLSFWTDANSPIPRSQSTNPGLFAEHELALDDSLSLTTGVRVDWSHANITDDPAKLAGLGTDTPQSSLVDILGTDDYERQYQLWSAFATLRKDLGDGWTLSTAAGHAQRAPSLTELYTAQTFLFLLQNGQNTATGDPSLDPERLWQVDVGLDLDRGAIRGGLSGFHAWINDYITFENLRAAALPPLGKVEQVSLQYVNTGLATLAGGEAYLEVDLNEWMTPFVTLSYVEGRDHDRNGSFATKRASAGQPKEKTAGLPRGHYSGIEGGEKEPLPAIVPLESRAGFRLHPPGDQPTWGAELYARIIDGQNRVASSLLESASPGFTTWNVRGFWHATDRLQLVAGVENFTDTNYREHLDFRSPSGTRVFQPGVNFYFGSELSY